VRLPSLEAPGSAVTASGPRHPDDQSLIFTVSTDVPTLFSAPPALAADGTLSFTPAPNAFGTAQVTVILRDDGGTERRGVDSSLPVGFTLDIEPVDDPPVLGAPASLQSDEGSDVAIILSASDLEGDPLVFSAAGLPLSRGRQGPEPLRRALARGSGSHGLSRQRARPGASALHALPEAECLLPDGPLQGGAGRKGEDVL